MALREILRIDLGQWIHGKHGHLWPGPRYVRLQRWRYDLLIVTEQIEAIVAANAPLVRGLDAAAMDAPNGNVEAMLLTLRDDLAAGESLADAMAFRPHFYPPFFVDLVRAGERTGRLDACLRDASGHIRRMVDHRSHKSQFWYPAQLFAIHLVLAAFMLVKVYPVFAEIATELDGRDYVPVWIETVLPYIVDRFVFLFGALAPAVLGIVLAPRLLRHRIGGAGLYVPFWRCVPRKRYLAQIARVMNIMLRADVPLDRALAECAVLAVPRVYRRALNDVTERVESGESLADSLARYPRLFHRPFRELIRLGERSGQLVEILERVASLYDAQTTKVRRIVVDYALAASVIAVGVLTLGGTLLIFQMNVVLVQAILERL